MTIDSTRRFTDRVNDYVLYRPRYPREILAYLESEGILSPASTLADLGSGTGFLSELFLDHGCTVYGVEPNEAMRAAGELHLTGRPNFRSIAATAEATTLRDASVDLVTAGQAMHWFDPKPTLAEIRRIARPPHWFAVVSNDRDLDASDFMRDYEDALNTATPEYRQVRGCHHSLHEWLDEPGRVRSAGFRNAQVFDRAGLIGRVLSSSYAPMKGPEHEALINGLNELFQRHQCDGRVTFHYRTKVEWAAMG